MVKARVRDNSEVRLNRFVAAANQDLYRPLTDILTISLLSLYLHFCHPTKFGMGIDNRKHNEKHKIKRLKQRIQQPKQLLLSHSQVFDVENHKTLVGSLLGLSAGAISLAFGPKGDKLAVGLADGKIHLIDIEANFGSAQGSVRGLNIMGF